MKNVLPHKLFTYFVRLSHQDDFFFFPHAGFSGWPF